MQFAALLTLLALPTLGVVAQDDKPAKDDDGKVAKSDDNSSDKQEAELPEDSLYRLKTKTLEGEDADLKDYQGKVTLVVNVASKCGYTPQYTGLEKLYEDLKDKGFVILGFPSNDFRGQEPGTPEEIRKFCTDKYEVTFPLFEKVQTKEGDGQSPIYANLKKQSEELPSWNFCKYLVGKDGKVIKFYASKVTPEDADLRKEIEAALKVEYGKADKTEDKPEKPAEGDQPDKGEKK
ncbi:MAG: glutathione peroxidase [Planctomycetes bacterium]|nr:glutathione peroxidase [Planctomycetota bacterium]